MNNYDLYMAAMHFAILYLSIIVLSGVFGTFGKPSYKNRKRYLFCVLSIIFVLMAFRGERMGSDTSNYIAKFNQIALTDNPFDYISNSSMEPGYTLYCWLLSRVVSNARILFIISSLIIVFSVGRFAEKYVDNLGVFFCLFFGTLYFDFFLSGLRNALSIAIFLFAIDYLLNRKPWKYFAVCLVAILFHNTAVICIFLYPLCSKRILSIQYRLVTYFVLVLVAFLSGFFFQPLMNAVFNLFPKYTYYIGSAYFDGKARFAVVMKIAVCVMLITAPKLVYKQPAKDKLLEGFGVLMALSNLLCMIIALNATIVMRIATLLHMYTLMQFSNEVSRVRRGSTNKILLITCTLAAFFIYGVIVVVFRTPEWQTTYPISLSWKL